MKILTFNQAWFADEWRAAGHEVLTCGYQADADFQPPKTYPHLTEILAELPGGFTPDRIAYFDNSAPPFFHGFGETEIPALFYAVDTHHHLYLHGKMANLFEVTLCAQRDFVQPLRDMGTQAEWIPLWASRKLEPQAEKRYGAVFIGTLNRKLNPERVDFFEALQAQTSILCAQGDFSEFFPAAEIVINQTVKGDVNFRVFEAMMSGAMLLTERSENGLFDLFREGEHLVTYEKGNVDDAKSKIEYFLAHPEETRRIAAAGRAEIIAKHTAANRASLFLRVLESLQPRPAPRPYFERLLVAQITAVWLIRKEVPAAKKVLWITLDLIQKGIASGEPITDEQSAHAISAAVMYDIILNSRDGIRVLHQLREAYPNQNLFSLACIRECLNRGAIEEATSLVRLLGDHDPVSVFRDAESVIGIVLHGFGPRREEIR